MGSITYFGKKIDTDQLVKKVSHGHIESIDVSNIDSKITDSNKTILIAIKREGVYVLLTGDATTLPINGTVQLNVITKHTLKLAEVRDVIEMDTKHIHSKNQYDEKRYGNTKPYRNGPRTDSRSSGHIRGSSRGN